MKVYSGFGYFKPDKTAVIEISLPLPVNNPNDTYKYEFVNISTTTYNGLLVFIKKTVDTGTVLSPCSINYESVPVSLDIVPVFTASGLTAQAFDYSKNFVLITYHEANQAVYPAISKQLFQTLNNIVATGNIVISIPAGASGPGKEGSGGVKKL